MLEMVDIGIENAVAYRLEGKITEEDMTSILAVFKEKIDKGEKIVVYQEVVSIGGVELDAMIEKFKFFFDVGFSHFNRIAVVAHKNWLHKLVDIEDKIFRNIDMKGFSVDEKDQAIEFLKNA
jgi:hypothetical protein